MARYDEQFTTIRSVGGLLPSDLLARVAAADRDLPGISRDDYHLDPGHQLREAVARSWNRLRGVWEAFAAARERLPDADVGTTLTRERWLLPLFDELGYGRLQFIPAVGVDGTAYPISHGWHHTPVHLVSFRLDLDRRATGVAGAARWSPHGMVQELLNRSEEHLWAFVSNGTVLRVLRDNVSLSRQAYLEFDLQAMMDGELYADFVVLWLVCHQSRVEGERPELCWLERWVETAAREGTRALDRLRDGVEQTLALLGSGLVSHPANVRLRARLSADELTVEDLYRQLLRLVYRLLFLFVAEDRDLLLLPPGRTKPELRDRYLDWYSTRRLRDLARHQVGSKHGDLWHALQLVMARLGSDEGAPQLALPPLDGELWNPDATLDLNGTSLRNDHLLELVRALAYTVDDKMVRAVDYRNLGAEELGSVYESLLELHPRVDPADWSFRLEAGAGSERKTTGSYYTPDSLINQLLDTALDPILDRAANAGDPEAAILSLKVVDPAVGSGHFLVAAANRIAKRLASVRTGEGEPSPDAVRDALRDVVSRCLYGVDVNPMALELAKVSLWLEAHVPGKPLTFLDHHLKVGNSLLGVTPALIARGIPDEAFTPIEGDEKKACDSYKRRNRELRGGQQTLLAAEVAPGYDTISGQAADLTERPDQTLEQRRAKERAHIAFEGSPALRRQRMVADAWFAAFTAPKRLGDHSPQPFEMFYELRDTDRTGPIAGFDMVADQVATYRPFHWHLEFPDVFTVRERPDADPDDPLGWHGGFDVVLGNPPWEHTELKEKEFFAARDEEVANAPTGAARKRKIERLADTDPTLFGEYLHAKRTVDGVSHVARSSGRFPLCGRGRINTYALFAELNRQNTGPIGRAGFIAPTGIAADHTTRFYFADLIQTRTLSSLLDFENRAALFPDVDSRMKFSLVTLNGIDDPVDEAEFAFFAHGVTDLHDPERRFTLTPEDIALINPNTLTAPVFRTRRDAEITRGIYRRVPVLVREGDPDGNPWGIEFMQGLFNMTSDSGLFRTRRQLEVDGWRLDGNIFVKGDERYLPLYEAKMIHQFDHRYATYVNDSEAREVTDQEKQDPNFEPLPRYWIPRSEVEAKLQDKGWTDSWMLGYRRVARSTDERTAIFSLLPSTGAGDSVFLMLPKVSSRSALGLVACANSFPFDFVARQKIGGMNLNFYLAEQLPMPPPCYLDRPCQWVQSSIGDWIAARTAELVNTSRSIAGDQAWSYIAARRFLLRCELDAAFFHVYGLDRDEVDYVMETFPIARRKDEQRHGEYRTKRLILEIYDEMAKAIESGEPYQTRLHPPPADPSLQHDD